MPSGSFLSLPPGVLRVVHGRYAFVFPLVRAASLVSPSVGKTLRATVVSELPFLPWASHQTRRSHDNRENRSSPFFPRPISLNS